MFNSVTGKMFTVLTASNVVAHISVCTKTEMLSFIRRKKKEIKTTNEKIKRKFE